MFCSLMCISSSNHGALYILGTSYLLAKFAPAGMNEKHELKTTVLVYKSFPGLKKCVPLIDPLTHLINSYLLEALMH